MSQETVSLHIVLSDYGLSSKDVITDVVNSHMLLLSRVGSSSPFLKLPFPCNIIDETCKAKYKAKSGTLTVSAQPAPAQEPQIVHGEEACAALRQAPCEQAVAEPPCNACMGAAEGMRQEAAATGPCNGAGGTADIAASSHAATAGPRRAEAEVADNEPDDATLLREFADEAYLVSLSLNGPTTAAPTVAASAPPPHFEQSPQPRGHSSSALQPQQQAQPTTATASSRQPGPPANSASSNSHPCAPAPPPTTLANQPAGSVPAFNGHQSVHPAPHTQAAPATAGAQAQVATQTAAPAAGIASVPVAATGRPAAAAAPTTDRQTDAAEPRVGLAAGVDGTGLAALLGCSFGPGLSGAKGGFPASGKVGSAKKSKKEERRKAAATLKLLADSLNSKGWAACDNFIPSAVVDEVRTEIKQMESHYTPGQIWVGKEADAGAQVAVVDVRGDSVLWMDEQALAATAFIKDGKKQACCFYTLQQVVHAVDQLIMQELPRYVPDVANLAAGGRSDAMLAIYPGRGSRFARHIDNSANDGRRLTCLCYLNGGWTEAMGGALRLFPPEGPIVDVLPLGGRVAFFWSKTVAHEVRPTQQPRHSFTLWYYDAIEKAEALASARVGGKGSAAAQAQAQKLLRDILAQDVITPTDEGCAVLAQRVKAMTTSALQIVAAVVGATTVQDFVYAASNMTPDGLAELRGEISRMGLQTHAPTV